MGDQISDEVKNARVEELMLAQQEVAFKKAESMVGQSIEVMIERPAGRDIEDGYVGRSQSQAPEIDSVVHVDSNGTELHAGQMIMVKVTDYQNYDLVAQVPKKKSRGLKVVTA
jgi:ribosomal protein S12 methylthiotransferase